MAGSNSSGSPSSSAVTIPIPGKSILKRPSPTPASLFSRITRFLPTPNQLQSPTSTEDASKPLKRAHFILPEIAIVYPISSVNPPSTPTLKEEKRAIELKEAERRRRVVRGNTTATSSPTSSPIGDSDDWWSMGKVESFYRECCEGCDEKPDLAITKAFKNALSSNPRSVDFSGVQLTITSASILSDVFTIEWGLRKLVFRECDLDDQILKPMLHALLIPDALSFLSVASNRRLKSPAFRLIGAYLSQSKTLQFLDLSQNALDKKSTEYIVAALTTPPDPGLVSLRLDDCSLRTPALEVLARAVRTSSLRNISLRHNRINTTGAIALALMIRDYPDVVPPGLSSPSSSTASSSASSSPTSSFTNLPPTLSIPSSPATASPTGSFMPASANASSFTRPIPPPPRHPTTGLQTTYTPYVPRSRRQPALNLANPNANASTVPLITSSSQGGVTTRHAGLDQHAHSNSNSSSNARSGVGRHDAGPSAALLDKVRALDALPRVGALRTLDLKGNDLRMGITYIAQVLKRNRTLKVLNLSENKLDIPCLVAIAEALKYNSCLETLDLSKNPCSGPGLEGIQSLRTAFTVNTALKRLFLSSTSLTSAGAIALAEFLPESTSLLHLDLTLNNLDIAGVMALSSGLKANHVMRCLDLNIPPGDEGFARMCRDILNSCVRNTEEAERTSQMNSGIGSTGRGSVVDEGAGGGAGTGASGRGLGKGVWNMIEESELAKSIRLDEENKTETDIAVRAKTCIIQLTSIISPTPGSNTPTPSTPTTPMLTPTHTTSAPRAASQDIVVKAKALVSELTTLIPTLEDVERMQELLSLNDQLAALLDALPPTPVLSQGRPVLAPLRGLGLSLAKGNDRGDKGSDANGGMPNGNGTIAYGADTDDEEVDGTPTTPRVDKGKAKAEPLPEAPEKVLSPTFLLAESSEDEDEDEGEHFVVPEEELEGPASPTNRSRSWVEEEGEVFRKGTVLLGPEEMEGEYAGEELRKELLEAMVERPPPRPLTDDFGLDIVLPECEPELPVSPVTAESAKPPPRPYVSRARSSSASIMSVLSPGASPVVEGEALGSPRTPTSPSVGLRPSLSRTRSSGDDQ